MLVRDFHLFFGTVLSNHVLKILDDDTKADIMPAILERPDDNTEVSHLFGIKQKIINRCLKCNEDKVKNNMILLCNLHFPINNSSTNASFHKLMKDSMSVQKTLSAYCENCNRFTPTNHHAKVESLPNILAINCGLDNEKEIELLKRHLKQIENDVAHPKVAEPVTTKPCRYGMNCTRVDCHFSHPMRKTPLSSSSSSSLPSEIGESSDQWFPFDFKIEINDEIVSVGEQKTETESENSIDNLAGNYDLYAVVYCIDDGMQKNLISLILHHEQWFIFNDFSIKPISTEEVTQVRLDWKTPCVLFYKNKNISWDGEVSEVVESPLTSSLFEEEPGKSNGNSYSLSFIPLSKDEIPKKGDLIAMDAEFVTLSPEISEIRSDGVMNTIKPSHLSVARITCIRG